MGAWGHIRLRHLARGPLNSWTLWNLRYSKSPQLELVYCQQQIISNSSRDGACRLLLLWSDSARQHYTLKTQAVLSLCITGNLSIAFANYELRTVN